MPELLEDCPEQGRVELRVVLLGIGTPLVLVAAVDAVMTTMTAGTGGGPLTPAGWGSAAPRLRRLLVTALGLRRGERMSTSNRAEVRRVRIHDLRHAAASSLLLQGVAMRVLMGRAGTCGLPRRATTAPTCWSRCSAQRLTGWTTCCGGSDRLRSSITAVAVGGMEKGPPHRDDP